MVGVSTALQLQHELPSWLISLVGFMGCDIFSFIQSELDAKTECLSCGGSLEAGTVGWLGKVFENGTIHIAHYTKWQQPYQKLCVCMCVCVYLRACMCVFVCMCWWRFHDVMQWVLCITSRLALFIPGDVVHWLFMYAWLLWLQEPVTSKNWDVNLGRLLLAAKQKVSLMKIFSCQTGKLFVLYLYDCDFLHFSLISRSLSG